jgi:hypothetical protein
LIVCPKALVVSSKASAFLALSDAWIP